MKFHIFYQQGVGSHPVHFRIDGTVDIFFLIVLSIGSFSWDVQTCCRAETLIQCCGSGMFIPDPDFYPFMIPDLGSRIQKQQQKRGVKKIWCHSFLCSHKFHKIENNFSFEVLKKKIWPYFQRIIELIPKKLSLSSQKYGFGIRDPRSGKTYSGSRIEGSKKHWIPDPDPQHCSNLTILHCRDTLTWSYKSATGWRWRAWTASTWGWASPGTSPAWWSRWRSPSSSLQTSGTSLIGIPVHHLSIDLEIF